MKRGGTCKMMITSNKPRGTGMNMCQIVQEIQSLAKCQGFYSRMYKWISDLYEYEPEKFQELQEALEAQNFKDAVDMVLFFEQ